MFSGRNLVIATKHNKERVIAPLLESALGVTCVTPHLFDTDQFGTFSGEITREDSPLETARKKCLFAMEETGCDLAVSSEGSFGPHPDFLFIPADDELILFIDKKNNLEIVAREITTETNYSGKEILKETELIEFSERVHFPSHRLILKASKDGKSDIKKGIDNIDIFLNTFRAFIKDGKSVSVETDMRACYNPTRMDVIKQATSKLVEKIRSHCPHCQTPGFGITAAREGLPCSLCGSNTRSILCYISTCQKCSFVSEEFYPRGKKEEDPMYCDHCNP